MEFTIRKGKAKAPNSRGSTNFCSFGEVSVIISAGKTIEIKLRLTKIIVKVKTMCEIKDFDCKDNRTFNKT